MTEFTLHTEETAPEESKPMIVEAKKAFGMLPGLFSVMAEAPGVYNAYNLLHENFSNSSFNTEELTVIWQAINVEHGCHYCVPAHTAIANMMNVDQAVTDALRNETTLPTTKLEALRDFTLSMVRERGRVDDDKVQAFLDAGFTKRQVLEVVLGISQKIMSNYINHLANTPVDAAFQPFAWEKASAQAAE
ncbi:MAG: carboxymuconolactone decarboxylase family protein [Methylocystaceae bacterium]|nr:carboxymuconolactone decarboxylase family protein [Methylocystaceae bacterium]